ncbi:NB-ARC domain-containing protein [Saccharothrix isguenensis]
MHSARLRVVDRGHGSYVYCDDLPPLCAGMVCCLGGGPAFTASGAEVALPPLAFRMLTFLASAVGKDVSIARIVDHLWAAGPPASARANVRSYASRIRSVFGHSALVRRHESLRLVPAVVPSDVYLLRVALDEVPDDVERLASLLDCLNFALADGNAGDPPSGEIRWSVLAARFVTDCFKRLPAPERGVLLPVLTTLRELDPLNEGLCALHMRVQQGLGDRAAALSLFAEHRLRLSTELGISPSTELQELNRTLLATEYEETPQPVHRVFELPSAPEVFLGRADDVDQAAALLMREQQAGKVLLIHGQPGVGKTAFAISLGHRLADSFADGVVYVEMHGNSGGKYDRSALLRVLLRSLGMPLAELPDEVDRMEATYRSLLHSRSLLVVLDDAPRGFDFSGLITASSRSALCITAREPNLYVPARRHLRLSVLSLDVAAQILLQNAGLAADETSTEIALNIVSSCGGLPLASRIIGGQLATDSLLSLEDVQRRVRRPRILLDSLEYGNLSVRRVIEASLDNLDERGVLLLALIVSARLPWIDADMVEAVLGPDVEFSPSNIEALVAYRIVDVRGTDRASYRFRIHDLVREVVKDSLPTMCSAPRELDAAVLRLLEWFLDAALRQHALLMGNQHFNLVNVPADPVVPRPRQSSGSPAEWIECYEEVVASLIEVAARGRWTKQAWQLAVTCAVLFEHTHSLSTWRRTHLAALAGARRQGDAVGEGAVLLELAELDLMPGSEAKAERWLGEALSVFQRMGHRRGIGIVEEKLGRIRFLQGRFTDARRHLRAAVAHFDQLQDKASAALAKRFLGQCYAEAGDVTNADTCYAEALALAVESSARRLEGQILNHMASLAIMRGQLDRAQEHCDSAYQIFDELGGAGDRAHVVCTEGFLLAARGDISDAYATAVRAEQLALKYRDQVMLRNARSLMRELSSVLSDRHG